MMNNEIENKIVELDKTVNGLAKYKEKLRNELFHLIENSTDKEELVEIKKLVMKAQKKNSPLYLEGLKILCNDQIKSNS